MQKKEENEQRHRREIEEIERLSSGQEPEKKRDLGCNSTSCSTIFSCFFGGSYQWGYNTQQKRKYEIHTFWYVIHTFKYSHHWYVS